MEVDTERTPLVKKDTSSQKNDVKDGKGVSIIHSGRMHIVLCVLCCELCERLTYYSIVANLVIYCTNKLGYTSADAITVSLVFSGTSYFVPVAGGWVADSISGRFNAIYGSLLIYFLESSDEKSLLLNKPGCSRSTNDDAGQEVLTLRDRRIVVMCILFCELCERLTYYGILGNLILYLTIELEYSSATASTISMVWTGFVYTLPLIGGFISDSILGRFKTILYFLIIYGFGTVILPVISIDYEALLGSGEGLSLSQQRGFYIFGLSLVALGTGGIKSNVGPFGAQQLEDLGEGAIQTFFNWFYWFINVGSAIAYSLVVYVQQEISFAWGYTIPAVSILLSVVALLVGRNKYITSPPEGSILTRIFKIIWQASSKCCGGGRSDDENVKSCLDRAKQDNGGSFLSEHVEQVKCIGRIIPVLCSMIMYWTIYVQMQTTYILQGERMNLVYNSFTFPVASLSLFNNISLLLLIPLMDTIVYPFLERKGYKLTLLKRIGFGMFLAALSMAVAAIVEVARKDIMRDGGYTDQVIANASYNASTLSVFAQVPQYFIVGASEVFTSITGLEFAYSQSPKVLQGVVMGLFLLTTGLGSYVGSLLVIIVNAATKGHEWFPDEINEGYLEYYYILLAGMMIANLGVFCIIAHYYTYVQYGVPLPNPPDYAEDIKGTDSADMKLDGSLDQRDKAALLKEGALSESEI